MVGPITSNVTRLRPAGDAETPRAQGDGGVRATPAPRPATGSDTVSLSGATGALPEAMLKGPPIDTATVERLGVEIAQGRYPIDPERIAAALCRECFDLPS